MFLKCKGVASPPLIETKDGEASCASMSTTTPLLSNRNDSHKETHPADERTVRHAIYYCRAPVVACYQNVLKHVVRLRQRKDEQRHHPICCKRRLQQSQF
jgi:hypothetical protein